MLSGLFNFYNALISATETCTIDANNELLMTEDSRLEMSIHFINSFRANMRYIWQKRFSIYYSNDKHFQTFRVSYAIKLSKGCKVMRNDEIYTLKDTANIKDCKDIPVVVIDKNYTMFKIANKEFQISGNNGSSSKINNLEILGIKVKPMHSFTLNDTMLSVDLNDVESFNKYTWEYSGDHDMSKDVITFQNDKESKEFLENKSFIFPIEESFLKELGKNYFVKKNWIRNPYHEKTIDKEYTVVLNVAKTQGKVTLKDKVAAEKKAGAPNKRDSDKTTTTTSSEAAPKKQKPKKDKKGKVQNEESEETTTEPKDKDKWSTKKIGIIVGSIVGGLIILLLIVYLLFRGSGSYKTKEII